MTIVSSMGSNKSPFFYPESEKPKKKFSLFQISNQMRLLSVVSHVLEISDRVTKTAHSRISFQLGLNAIDDTKTLLGMMQVPGKIHSTVKSFDKYKLAHSKSITLTQKTVISIIWVATFLRRIFSIFLKAILHPCRLVEKKLTLNDCPSTLKTTCKIFSLCRSLFHSIALIGKLTQNEKVIQRSIALILETGECVIRCLKLSAIRVHPAIHLTVITGKGLLELYKMWAATR